MSNVQFLNLKGRKIAYVKTQGKGPGVIFCGGFRSDMTGEKAMALEAFCKEHGQAFVRFDYTGHGQSSGEFKDGTIGSWMQDALDVLVKLTEGPQLIIGSSMGGWIALLIAIAKPKRVAGIIGIAAAPDFTEYLMWEKLTKAQKAAVEKKGFVEVPSDYGGTYPITAELIADGRKHLLLHDTIPVYCPVHLIHGLKDADVPWETALAINEKLATPDVKCNLFPEGTHRLSEPDDIKKILKITEKMLDHVN